MASKTSKQLTILAVVAHPHDITHMCGTLAHHVQDGDQVTAVTVTGGSHIHRQRLEELQTSMQRGARRQTEWGEAVGLTRCRHLLS